MIISSLPMCAVRADGLNFASLEASVQGERVSRNFALTEFSEVRIAPVQQPWATRPRTGAICCLYTSVLSSRVRATPFSSLPPPERLS